MPVPKGSLGKYTPVKPSTNKYIAVVTFLALYSIVGGYYAGIQPTGEWRFFSWHPLLMTTGMIGCAGIGAMTKKMGGYVNTKIHGFLGFCAVLCSMIGLWVIYRNKEMNGYFHLKTTHSLIGIVVMMAMVGLGMVGGVVLHPDFGIDKTNQNIRFAHKTASRLTLIVAWTTAFMGLYQLVTKGWILVVFGLPLVILTPICLM